VYCSVLHCVVVYSSVLIDINLDGMLQKGSEDAVRCSALQCIAVHCSVFQCVAVRCSALHCVDDEMLQKGSEDAESASDKRKNSCVSTCVRVSVCVSV